MADERGLKFVQAHSPLGRPLVFDDERGVRSSHKANITAAAYLGIPISLCIRAMQRICPRPRPLSKTSFYEDILKVAEKHGITVLTENFNKMFDEHYYWWILRRSVGID
ncbi:MAG: hypothetical protein ACLR56_04040 [Oscillospiraceae bacterium]